MAKSIRSKVKKRNRTEMRKTVGDPHQKMLQARCTAKILNSVGYGSGQGVAKLRSILTTAQEANPPTKEVSKNKFSFRHPDAPPPHEECPDARALPMGLPDAETPVEDDSAMTDVDDAAPVDSRESTSEPNATDKLAPAANDRHALQEKMKLKKKLKRAKRRGGVEFPAVEN